MKVHNVNIHIKYYEPIREGLITLLIFRKKVIHGEKSGDYILAERGSYSIKAEIKNTYYKCFKDITDEDAKKMGYLNRDFLKEELINQYSLIPNFSFELGTDIDNEIFFFIELKQKNFENYYFNDSTKVNLYNINNYELYNSEYDIKPWRDI